MLQPLQGNLVLDDVLLSSNAGQHLSVAALSNAEYLTLKGQLYRVAYTATNVASGVSFYLKVTAPTTALLQVSERVVMSDVSGVWYDRYNGVTATVASSVQPRNALTDALDAGFTMDLLNTPTVAGTLVLPIVRTGTGGSTGTPARAAGTNTGASGLDIILPGVTRYIKVTNMYSGTNAWISVLLAIGVIPV